MSIFAFIAGAIVGVLVAGLCMIDTKNHYDKKSIELQDAVDEHIATIKKLTTSLYQLKTLINKRGK